MNSHDAIVKRFLSMSADDAIAEMFLSKQGSDIEKAYGNSVKSKLGYRMKGSCKESHFPIKTYCIHHSNPAGDEGLIANFCVMAMHADVAVARYRSRSRKVKTRRYVREMDTQLEYRFFGYGKKWEKFRWSDAALKSPLSKRRDGMDCNKILNVPKREIYKLDGVKIEKLLELDPFFEEILGKFTKIEPIKSDQRYIV